MKVTLTDLDLSQTEQGRESNRAKLSVPGEPVIAKILSDGDLPHYVRDMIPEKYFAASVEVYPDGDMNIFLRRFAAPTKMADKLITVRKED